MEIYKEPFCDDLDIFVEKKSKFIGHIFKVYSEAEAKEKIAIVRKEHFSATHNCFAYITKEDNIERFSDDGEPQATAGKPILEVLRKENITNVCAVVTRYYGGTLLGTGGLVRAYSKATQAGLLKAGICEMLPFLNISISCEYNFYDIIMKNFENYTIYVVDTNYSDKIEINFDVLKEEFDRLSSKITEISHGKIKLNVNSETRKGKRII